MRITRFRSLTTIAAGALVLTALTGCGSDDKTKDAASTPSASGSPSDAAGASTSATPEAADTGDVGPAAAPGERLTADNLVATMLAAMRDKQTAHMTMDLGTSVSATADVRYAGTGTDMRMSMKMGPQAVQVILVDGTMYLQQGGDKYVKIDKNDPTLGATLSQFSSLGPEGSISAMKGAVKKVDYAGTDTVGGDKVDKYRVTIDTSAVAQTLGGTGGISDLPETVTYDLYVDHDHLMRRIDMTVSDQHITMLVSDWGKPVDIKAPPASQILSP